MLVFQGSRLPWGLVLQWLCPSPFPLVSPGVPRTTTWTPPPRCCRSGWRLWVMTMQLWSGGPRGSLGGDLRGKVLGKTGSSCKLERKRDSTEPQPPGQGSVHCSSPTPWEHPVSLPSQVLPRRRGSQALDQRKAPVSDGIETGSPDLCQRLGG